MKKLLLVSLFIPLVSCQDVEVRKTYYDSGELKSTENYVDDVRQGESKYYFKDGKLFSTVNYIDDIKQGEYKIFYESGELKRTENYVDDLRQGEWKYYWESGELKRTENYGNLCLLSITNYSQNGNRINETDNFGKECGDYGSTFTTFYENGNIKSKKEMNYESVGYVEYYINGQEKIEWFKGIEIDESSCWDEDGNKIECN